MSEAGSSSPTVSAVIAAWEDTSGLSGCLEALAPQRSVALEILVVGNVAIESAVRQRFPWVIWVQAEPFELTPHLWERGIRRSRGEVVVITTAHFVPGRDWLAAIRAAHGRLAAPAVGGRIDPPAGGTPRGWATYLLRYSQYLSHRVEQPVTDLAGDNASYKRAALQSLEESPGQGFWEQEFHRALLEDGKSLLFVPEIAVRQAVSAPFWQFSRQRFQHGRRYGAARVLRFGPLERALRISTAPLIPAVFLAKIFRRVVGDGRYLGVLLRSLPILAAYLLFWAAGETCGYLGFGPRVGPPRSRAVARAG
jgi:hypothetical protein